MIHDGPVQHLAAIAQMLDAASPAPRRTRASGAAIVARALELTREASSDLRELVAGSSRTPCASRVSRPRSQLAERQSAGAASPRADVTAGDALGENAQVGLYQIVRESLDQAVRRGPPTRVAVSMRDCGGVELVMWTTARRSGARQ